MPDHLLHYDDELEAQAALSTYWLPDSDDGPGQWRGDVCNPGQSTYTLVGSTHTDYDGFFITIAAPEIDAALRDGGACWLIVAHLFNESATCDILWQSDDIDSTFLTNGFISPVWMSRG